MCHVYLKSNTLASVPEWLRDRKIEDDVAKLIVARLGTALFSLLWKIIRISEQITWSEHCNKTRLRMCKVEVSRLWCYYNNQGKK